MKDLVLPPLLASYCGLSLSAKVVWGVLAAGADEFGLASPKVADVAAAICVDRKVVLRAVAHLAREGLLFKARRGQGKENQYHLVLGHALLRSPEKGLQEVPERDLQKSPEAISRSPEKGLQDPPTNKDRARAGVDIDELVLVAGSISNRSEPKPGRRKPHPRLDARRKHQDEDVAAIESRLQTLFGDQGLPPLAADPVAGQMLDYAARAGKTTWELAKAIETAWQRRHDSNGREKPGAERIASWGYFLGVAKSEFELAPVATPVLRRPPGRAEPQNGALRAAVGESRPMYPGGGGELAVAGACAPPTGELSAVERLDTPLDREVQIDTAALVTDLAGKVGKL